MRLPKGGIVRRSVLIALLAFLVASAGSIAYTIKVTGQRATQTIDIRLHQLLETVQSTVRIACFLSDQDLAKEVTLGLLSNSEVLRVTITAGGVVLADERRSTGADSRRPAAANVLVRQVSSPFNPGQTVGEVRLEPDPEFIEASRNQDVALAAKQLVWQLLLMTVVIIGSLVFFLVRPISRLSLALHQMDPAAGDRLEIPPGHQDTEIGRLVRDVNDLAGHLVQALEAARSARGAAEAASVAKSAFLANMSHEIRTPLNAVLGLARIGARDNAGLASGETFRRILLSGEHLLGIVNDILDFSKIEAAKLTIDVRPLCLAELIDDTLELVAGRAADKGLELICDTAADLPAWVAGDGMRIRQILVNLLANAVKFTAHGRIVFAVRRADDAICFAVQDEGIGMSGEQISRLFTPFEQADSSTTRNFGGTGLGLAISMSLARLMAGRIEVSSSLGKGSVFTLLLHLPEVAAPTDIAPRPLAAGSASALRGLRILAAEDIEVNRLILEDTLTRAGATCSFAVNGQEALDKVCAAPGDFDLVLMDVQMPVMDGHEATRRIKAIVPELPVIGLTAHVLSEERDKCLAAGMVGHVAKPVDPEVLVATILRHASRETGAPEVAPALPESPPVPTPPAAASRRIDWVELDRRFAPQPGLVLKLVRAFIDNYATTPAELRRLAAAAAFDDLAFLAHAQKGALGNLAADELSELAATLEMAARQHDQAALDQAALLAGRLEEMQQEIRQYLTTA